MNKEQMEDAVAEMRLLIDLFERGVLEQDYPGKAEANLRLVLRDRQLWLSAYSAEAEIPQDELKRIEDEARMYTKAQAIEYLRFTGHIEPLRKVVQEWLGHIFVREQCSKAWIDLAAIIQENKDREAIIKSIPAFQWQPKKGKRSVPPKLMSLRNKRR
jgi:hypothetical protein